MYDYIITTDSSCDLSEEYCRQIGVRPLKMSYSIGDESFVDDMRHESYVKLYDKMRAGAMPTTSQINIYDFQNFWTPMLAEGKPILHISLGGGISGSYRNALTARDLVAEEHPGTEIYVLNSTSASAGVGLIVDMAARLRAEGKSVTETFEELERVKPGVIAVYTTPDLKYLCAGGRVSRVGAVVGSVLNINPILDLDREGHLKVFCKARGKKQTMKQFAQIVSQRVIDPQEQTVFISNADCPERGEEFARMLKEECGFRDAFHTDIGAIIGSHTGPGLVAVFFLGRERESGYVDEN